MSLPIVEAISAKMEGLRSLLQPVGRETIPILECTGRVLSQNIVAWRDSPAMDVSAMDGYALRLTDLSDAFLPVSGIAHAGSPPIACEPGTAVRIFTGAAVPSGAECVVQREWCEEGDQLVRILPPLQRIQAGLNIRRRGENARMDSVILCSGTLVGAAQLGAIVSMNQAAEVSVHRRIRVTILNTGDELIPVGQPLQAWQIRDSNGPLIASLLSGVRWASCTRHHVPDDRDTLQQQLHASLQQSDAVLLTGGVSMGDTDYVPDTIAASGGSIQFHRIPIRPGKPMLGAVGPRGQLILGLPGNPLSVAVTLRRFALPLLRHLAGWSNSADRTVRIRVKCDTEKTLDLLWFRLVALGDDGVARILDGQGSGDVAALGKSDGFVEIPPGTPSNGEFPFFDWRG